jgi:hypothetical protein
METQAGFFRSVQPLPQHKLEVVMETDTHIVFDFTSRLGTMRFGALVDDDLFDSVRTDGNFILFGKPGAEKIRIGPADFADLMLVDRMIDGSVF